MLFAAILLTIMAFVLLWQSARKRKCSGIPAGRIIYSDTRFWSKTSKPFFDSVLGLTGKPDYIVKLDGPVVPVEVKSSLAPPLPYEGHIYQLIAYCILIERSGGIRPPYGILHYRNRDFAIDFTPEAEEKLLDVLAEMRKHERRALPRSHESTARCSRCGYRSVCDQKL